MYLSIDRLKTIILTHKTFLIYLQLPLVIFMILSLHLILLTSIQRRSTDKTIRHTAQKKKFSIKDFFSKCGWSHLPKKLLMNTSLFVQCHM